MHRETSKFKQSVLTLVSPVSSIALETITFYCTYNPDNDLIWRRDGQGTSSESHAALWTFRKTIRIIVF